MRPSRPVTLIALAALLGNAALSLWAWQRLPDWTDPSRTPLAQLGVAALLFILLVLGLPRLVVSLAESERDARFALTGLALTNVATQIVATLIALDFVWVARTGQRLAPLGLLIGGALFIGILGLPLILRLNREKS